MPWDDDIADEEWVEDDADDSADDLLLCPSCGRDVHEDTQQCPHCGDWITPIHAENRAKKWFFPIVVTLLVIALSGLILL